MNALAYEYADECVYVRVHAKRTNIHTRALHSEVHNDCTHAYTLRTLQVYAVYTSSVPEMCTPAYTSRLHATPVDKALITPIHTLTHS